MKKQFIIPAAAAIVLASQFMTGALAADEPKKTDDVIVIGSDSPKKDETPKTEEKPKTEVKTEDKKTESPKESGGDIKTIGSDSNVNAETAKPAEDKKEAEKDKKPADETKDTTAPDSAKTQQSVENTPAAEPAKAAASETVSLDAPSGLSAKYNDKGIEISWTSVKGASLYKLYRSESSEITEKDFMYFVPEIQYLDSDVTDGKTYYYKVASAVKDKANPKKIYESKLSDVIKVETADKTAPETPQKIGVKVSGKNIVINWEKNGASDFSYYVIYKGKNSSELSELKRFEDINKTEYTDEDCAGGQAYYYAVSAVDKKGNESKKSDVKNGQTEDLTPPAAAGGLKCESAENGAAKISWQASSSKNADKYVILRGTENSVSSLKELKTSKETNFEDKELANGKTYYYAVVTIGVNGIKSEASEILTVKVKDTQAPSAPANIAAAVSGRKVSLSWPAVKSDDIAGYVIYRGESENGNFEPLNNGAKVAEPNYADSKTSGGKTYYYKISAIDEAGNESEKSAAIKIKTKVMTAVSFNRYSSSGFYGFSFNPDKKSVYYSETSDGKSWKWWNSLQESLPLPEEFNENCRISFAKDGAKVYAFIYDTEKTSIQYSVSADGGKSWKWWTIYSSSLPLPDTYEDGAIINFSVKGTQTTCLCLNMNKKTLTVASTNDGKSWKWWANVGENLGELPNSGPECQYSVSRTGDEYNVFSYNLHDLTIYTGVITSQGRNYSSWNELSNKFPKPSNAE